MGKNILEKMEDDDDEDDDGFSIFLNTIKLQQSRCGRV